MGTSTDVKSGALPTLEIYINVLRMRYPDHLLAKDVVRFNPTTGPPTNAPVSQRCLAVPRTNHVQFRCSTQIMEGITDLLHAV